MVSSGITSGVCEVVKFDSVEIVIEDSEVMGSESGIVSGDRDVGSGLGEECAEVKGESVTSGSCTIGVRVLVEAAAVGSFCARVISWNIFLLFEFLVFRGGVLDNALCLAASRFRFLLKSTIKTPCGGHQL